MSDEGPTPRETDPDRHLYGLRMQLEQSWKTTGIETTVMAWVLAPVLVAVGIVALSSPPTEGEGENPGWIWWMFIALGVAVGTFAVVSTVRGVVRWRRRPRYRTTRIPH